MPFCSSFIRSHKDGKTRFRLMFSNVNYILLISDVNSHVPAEHRSFHSNIIGMTRVMPEADYSTVTVTVAPPSSCATISCGLKDAIIAKQYVIQNHEYFLFKKTAIRVTHAQSRATLTSLSK
jgi:hypothetical protein